MDQKYITELINELIKLGENKAEMEFWLESFPNLSDDEQHILKTNLERQLEFMKQEEL